jgi:outer membrane protein assembly factor BamB
MSSRSCTTALIVIGLLASASILHAVDIWTVGVNNTRQGWNKLETVLTPANVPTLKKIREFVVDEKIDVSPLVVGDKLYVFTMTNTAYIFNVNTGAQLFKRQLAAPFDPADVANPPGLGMDLHNIYRKWGITATPVIDVATNTIYVTTFGRPTATSPNIERINMLWILDANTLMDTQQPVLIAGNADNGGAAIANGFTTPYQKMRSGLGLLTDGGGNKAVVISFSINGEHKEGPGHGFVVAYDVRGLNREAGFTPAPAIWNVTPDGGAGGIWMSGSGPAIDGNDIYLATGNGMDPGRKAGNFAESFVKLRYTAGVAGVNGGKPQLAVADFWGAFSDFDRADEDQDLGAAGVVLVPERGNLIGGGKDGIVYNLNKDDLGKTTWNPQFNLPFVATYLPNMPNGAAGLPTTTPANPNWPIVNRDRNLPAQTPTGKSHHIHGTPVYMERATTAILYLWGENERLKAYNIDLATRRITGFRAEGTQFASGNMQAPGGMPGGRLVVSSNGTMANTAVIWGVYPTQGNANAAVVHGALVAYDATAVVNGKLKQLFHSDANPANNMGNFAKYATPVVANGKVYVATFSNKVIQYGL